MVVYGGRSSWAVAGHGATPRSGSIKSCGGGRRSVRELGGVQATVQFVGGLAGLPELGRRSWWCHGRQ
jgi:hypothetical protein